MAWPHTVTAVADVVNEAAWVWLLDEVGVREAVSLVVLAVGAE